MHALKFGAGIKDVRAHNESLPNGFGAYYFLGGAAQPYLFNQRLATTDTATIVEPHSFSTFAFLQDDWRFSPHLSLNLGVRYDIERISNVRHFDADTDKNNIQPRVGVAWEPVEGGIVFRGGLGIYTQQHLFNAINKVQLEAADGAANVTIASGSAQFPTFPNVLPSHLTNLPPRDVQVVDSSFRNPYSIQATAGGERTIRGVNLGADY